GADAGDSLSVAIEVVAATASRPAGDPRDRPLPADSSGEDGDARAGGGGPRLGGGRVFLQMRGRAEVHGRIDGREISFRGPGASETFVEVAEEPGAGANGNPAGRIPR